MSQAQKLLVLAMLALWSLPAYGDEFSEIKLSYGKPQFFSQQDATSIKTSPGANKSLQKAAKLCGKLQGSVDPYPISGAVLPMAFEAGPLEQKDEAVFQLLEGTVNVQLTVPSSQRCGDKKLPTVRYKIIEYLANPSKDLRIHAQCSESLESASMKAKAMTFPKRLVPKDQRAFKPGEHKKIIPEQYSLDKQPVIENTVVF